MSLEMKDLDMEVDEYAKVYEPATDSLVPVIDISPLIDLTSSPQ
jgi:hypothetical protein